MIKNRFYNVKTEAIKNQRKKDSAMCKPHAIEKKQSKQNFSKCKPHAT